MYNSSINDIISLKKLMHATVWIQGELSFNTKQKYLTVIIITEKAGGILHHSENQKVLSLKNLHIQQDNLQGIDKKFIEKSCSYTKLTKSLFQENHLLFGNLPDNKSFAFG